MLIKTYVPMPRWVGIKESGRPKPALLDSGRPRTGLLSSGIVYTIEGIETNGTLMQNMDEHLITNRLHVRIYSVSRFRACHYIGTSYYYQCLLSLYISIQTDFMIETCAYSWRYAYFVHHIYVYSTYRCFPRWKFIDLQNQYENL